MLFVIDGAPGPRRATTDVFGSLGVVQWCQVHKLRNVLGHLPERLHASVGKALRDAWGLEETLTVQRLGLTGSLERTLRTTNIIENLMGSVEGLHAACQAVARPDDSTLGGERAGGGGAALPAGAGLPRPALPGRRLGRTGPARRRGC